MAVATGFLPPLLVTVSGRGSWPHPTDARIGYLVRDIRIDDLVGKVSHAPSHATIVLDVDSVDGLASDPEAIDFVTGTLGVHGVMTRRSALASRAADMGAIGLLRVFALDSTGLDRGRTAHPRRPGMGTVISPGILLPSLSDDDIGDLPHPLVSDGMIQDGDDVRASWAARADTVVVGAPVLARMLLESGLSGRA